METTAYKKESEVFFDSSKQTSFEGWHKALFAGFWVRFFAYLIDLISVAALCGIFVRPLYRLFQIEVREGLFSSIWLFETIIFLMYFVLMTKFFQQTLGKMLFGLKVIRSDQKKLTWMNVIFREGVMRLFLKILWPLYVVVAFTPYKQGLADFIENTSVVHESLLSFQTNYSQ